MAYSDTSIVIHFINDIASKKEDDVIRIRKDYETNEFEITYTDQNDGHHITHKSSGLYRASVLEYMYTVFKNQALDEDYYKHVQLTLPSMPRVIVSGDKFKEVYYREHFLEAIGTGLDMLDNTETVNKEVKIPSVSRKSYVYETPVTRRSSAPQHLYFDNDE